MEILIALAISAVIAAPIFGLLTVTLKTRKPATENNAAYSQFGLARVSLQRDWSRAEIVRVKPTGGSDKAVGLPPDTEDGLECNQAGNTTAYNAVNAQGIGNELLLSMQSNERFDGTFVKRRTVYILRHTGLGMPKEILRRRCERERNGVYPNSALDVDSGGWRRKPGSMEFNIGSACAVPLVPPASTSSTTSTTQPLAAWQDIDCGTAPRFDPTKPNAAKYEVVASGIESVAVSPVCNQKAQASPTTTSTTIYEPCDTTVTMTAVGGETATIRLRQQAGRVYKEGS